MSKSNSSEKKQPLTNPYAEIEALLKTSGKSLNAFSEYYVGELSESDRDGDEEEEVSRFYEKIKKSISRNKQNEASELKNRAQFEGNKYLLKVYEFCGLENIAPPPIPPSNRVPSAIAEFFF